MFGSRITSSQKTLSKSISADALSKVFAVVAGTFSNNTPSAGYVSWSGVKVQYKGVEYTITNGNTNLGYIFWDLTSPTVFQASSTFPALNEDRIIVGFNVSGTWVTQWKGGQTIYGQRVVAATLDVISANMGSITAGTMTGCLIKTAASGQRIQMDSSNGIVGYTATETVAFQIPLPTTALLMKAIGMELALTGGNLLIRGGDGTSGSHVRLITATGATISGSAEIMMTHHATDPSLQFKLGNVLKLLIQSNKITTYNNMEYDSIKMAASAVLDLYTNSGVVFKPRKIVNSDTTNGPAGSMTAGETCEYGNTSSGKTWWVHYDGGNYLAAQQTVPGSGNW